MSQKQPKALFERYKLIQAIGTEIEVPFYEVSRLIHGSGHQKLQVFGNQVCMGPEADYASLGEARKAIAWYVTQLGGKVEWQKWD